jgi:hypothetical protein
MPSKWQPRYTLKRIKDEDIEISQQTRDEILRQLAGNGKYVQIGEYTIMLNAIKSIDPKWGKNNVPPKPKPIYEYTERPDKDNTVSSVVTNQGELDEWDKWFKDKLATTWEEK